MRAAHVAIRLAGILIGTAWALGALACLHHGQWGRLYDCLIASASFFGAAEIERLEWQG